MQIAKPTIIILTVILFIITQIILPITISINPNTNTIYKITSAKEKNKIKQIWKIEIPKINLTATINDGIDDITLNKYVGHFPQSGYIGENVCLAAHNRGYDVNYFEKIKELQKGDKIIYRFNDLKLTYKVDTIKVIKDTDIDVIENTRKNQITLITCVENEPELRRCIKGKLVI